MSTGLDRLLQASSAADCQAADLVAVLTEARQDRRRDLLWLVLALLQAELPLESELDERWWQLLLDGPERVLADRPRTGSTLEVVTGEVLVDVHHTAIHPTRNGIQRVVSETVPRWARDHPLRLVAWEDDWAGLRGLTTPEQSLLTTSGEPARPGRVIPWHSTLLLAEIAGEPARADRLRAMASSGAVTLSAIVYDLVPVTAANTTDRAMPGPFALYLGALKHARIVATISGATQLEMLGHHAMLAGQGLPGPAVVEVALPAQAKPATAAGAHALAAVVAGGDPSAPLVLCVGTHEPRKNHLAVLQAAELLWQDGVALSLLFLGNSGWGSSAFLDKTTELQRAGRRLHLVQGADDELLWAAYHAARVLVFPSLHEGFGLPVAEALACGTPVVTSNIGSMAELGQGGGALLIDPHDDAALASALRAVLGDDALHARLALAASARPVRTWDDYARECWAALTGPDLR